jgi:hypothetical protein
MDPYQALVAHSVLQVGVSKGPACKVLDQADTWLKKVAAAESGVPYGLSLLAGCGRCPHA